MVDVRQQCYWPSYAYGQSHAHLTQSVAVGWSPVHISVSSVCEKSVLACSKNVSLNGVPQK